MTRLIRNPDLAAALDDNDIDIDAGEPLIIKRSLKADGGSKAFINDQPCSAALLRSIGGQLIEIHGQHDDRGLINPKGHRKLLDVYAGVDGAKVAHGIRSLANCQSSFWSKPRLIRKQRKRTANIWSIVSRN